MSNSVCMLHTDRPATANCAECNRPLCQECTQIVASKPVCQTCVTAIRSRVATQLNYEAAASQPAQTLPPQAANPPYGAPGAYPPAGQQPAAPAYGAPRTDFAGNVYNPPPGSQYPPQQPYGAPQNPAYPSQPQAPAQGYSPQAPYGSAAQPGYGAQPPLAYGQPGSGQPPQSAPGQPGYNPYGTAQPSYPNAQAPYGSSQQPYPGQNPYAGQPARPLTPQPAASGVGNYVLGIGLGLLAAIVGAGLYIGVIVATGFSIGYMALAVGFLVGWAVKLGMRIPSPAAGIIAAVLTVLAILPARLLIFLGESHYGGSGSGNPASLLFTALFLFIGCRWAYSIASGTGSRRLF